MKKRRNTPQADDATETIAIGAVPEPGGTARATEIAQECAMIAQECTIATAPKVADAPAPAAAETPQRQMPPEPASIQAAHARKEPPALPRAAILGPSPGVAPRVESPVPNPSVSTPVAAAAATERRPRRFALLAASLALSASLGAIGGSLAVAEIGRLLAPPPPPAALAAAVHGDASEEIRALKDSVAQLRTNLKTIGDNVAAVRAGLNASFSSSTAQFAKLTEAIDKLDRHNAERHAAAAAAPPPAPAAETTGSIASAPGAKPAKPGVVDGWVLRKAYRGAALVEGRYGIIEIEPGDNLPGVGRVEEIKRQDGRWVVVTPKGLIVGLQ